MAKERIASDEEIISALLHHKTVKEAAAAVGMSPSTVYNRMAGSRFRKSLQDAVNAVADIMNDEAAAPDKRRQATETILYSAARAAVDRHYKTADNAPTNFGKGATGNGKKFWTTR